MVSRRLEAAFDIRSRLYSQTRVNHNTYKLYETGKTYIIQNKHYICPFLYSFTACPTPPIILTQSLSTCRSEASWPLNGMLKWTIYKQYGYRGSKIKQTLRTIYFLKCMYRILIRRMLKNGQEPLYRPKPKTRNASFTILPFTTRVDKSTTLERPCETEIERWRHEAIYDDVGLIRQ